jgi:ribonucleotide reductase alpha subunit
MPTASTSQLLGNNECIEPFTSNLYKRRTVAGQFIVINKYLVEDLNRLGIWNENIKDYLLQFDGSVQNIEGLSADMKLLYRTAYEIPQFALIQQAIDRQPFVDQAQSLNLYCHEVNASEYTKLMFYAWHGMLKTGKYYMHTKPATSPQKFTIDPTKQKIMLGGITAAVNNDSNEEPTCLLCSS